MIRLLYCSLAGCDSQSKERLYRLASPQRQMRADRYRKEEDRLRCLIADGLLRYAVGKCTVETGPQGKPYLPEHPDIHFNLSHSGNWVVLAVGDHEVGVDLERTDRNVDRTALAKRHFTPEELASGEDFFAIWTAKESYLKYLGVGLTEDLRGFCVLPGKEPEGVRFFSMMPDNSYCLTLCTTQEEETVQTLFLTCGEL